MTDALSLRQALAKARAGTDALFALIRPDALHDRPVAERHRLIFYFGHLEAFDWNLIRETAGLAPFHPSFDRLFAFGIDPEPGQLPQDQPADWPEVAEVHRYNRRIRETLDEVSSEVSAELLSVALEHRLMHAETFAYLLHHVPTARKMIPPAVLTASRPVTDKRFVEIPAGPATMGQPRASGGNGYQFGWDNEFDGHQVFVPAFAMSRYKVTNGEFLEFVQAGARPPHFWTKRGDQWWWRSMSGEVPLPLDWPVYATQDEAQAYAAWVGKRLPTEPEFQRAAYGTPDGDERLYAWGKEPPDSRQGNFNERRWDPLAVTATPAGDSAFGIAQLVGNGWEWTSTTFQPFPGFQPFPFYPGYSARFFDGQHYVLKGASPRTPAPLLRRSFRNWFRPNYPYVYAGFRCVEK
ncbi:MAG TPA: SUMF1/EgtB/PvdO family nonheme iron enzyme [Nitrospiraceae bacterium]|nr:SUMF1/EgtB/PvdO family nonheme iron enzyme [Nitrospiraceae bacterium]